MFVIYTTIDIVICILMYIVLTTFYCYTPAYIKFLYVDADHHVTWECRNNAYTGGVCPQENVALAVWSRKWDMDIDTRRQMLATSRTNTLGCIELSGLAYTLENSE